MNESRENTNIIYPTKEDVKKLRIIVENKSTGANVHKLVTCVSILGQIVILARLKGWDENRLKQYNDEKEKLNKLLLGIK